jgi:hypothetical protein
VGGPALATGERLMAAPPRYVPLADADRFVGLPAGVVGGWVASGLVTTTLFVHRGVIVRGVSTLECRVLVDAMRARKIARARRAG